MLPRTATTEMPPTIERRKRLRVSLHLELQLFRQLESEPIDSKTENLSSEGFYCLTDVPVRQGEHLGCLIMVPSLDPRAPDATLGLHCRIRVVRVDGSVNGKPHGIGCRIEAYSIMKFDSAPAA